MLGKVKNYGTTLSLWVLRGCTGQLLVTSSILKEDQSSHVKEQISDSVVQFVSTHGRCCFRRGSYGFIWVSLLVSLYGQKLIRFNNRWLYEYSCVFKLCPPFHNGFVHRSPSLDKLSLIFSPNTFWYFSPLACSVDFFALASCEWDAWPHC